MTQIRTARRAVARATRAVARAALAHTTAAEAARHQAEAVTAALGAWRSAAERAANTQAAREAYTLSVECHREALRGAQRGAPPTTLVRQAVEIGWPTPEGLEALAAALKAARARSPGSGLGWYVIDNANSAHQLALAARRILDAREALETAQTPEGLALASAAAEAAEQTPEATKATKALEAYNEARRQLRELRAVARTAATARAEADAAAARAVARYSALIDATPGGRGSAQARQACRQARAAAATQGVDPLTATPTDHKMLARAARANKAAQRAVARAERADGQTRGQVAREACETRAAHRKLTAPLRATILARLAGPRLAVDEVRGAVRRLTRADDGDRATLRVVPGPRPQVTFSREKVWEDFGKTRHEVAYTTAQVTVPYRWTRAVAGAGLEEVGGLVTLDAKAVEGALPGGVVRAWSACWITQSRGREICAETGWIAEGSDGERAHGATLASAARTLRSRAAAPSDHEVATEKARVTRARKLMLTHGGRVVTLAASVEAGNCREGTLGFARRNRLCEGGDTVERVLRAALEERGEVLRRAVAACRMAVREEVVS